VGCPLAGDALYAALAAGAADGWAAAVQAEDPLAPIALQAFRMEVSGLPAALGACRRPAGGGAPGDGSAAFEAGPPWWRRARGRE
jgi:hypothetical protein